MIAEPFELLQLPRFSQKASNVIPTYVDNETLFVGASGSSISQLGLRPPQTLRTHAVAPHVGVTSVLARENRAVAYGSVERSRNRLHSLADAENPQHVDLPGFPALICESVDRSVLGVLTMGPIPQALAFSAENLAEIAQLPVVAGTLRFCTELDSGDEELTTILLVSEQTDHSLRLQILALDSRGFAELRQSPINLTYDEQMRFSLSENVLYIAKSNVISAYAIPTMECLDTLSGSSAAKPITGLLALTNANLAILRENELELVDFTFRSLISRRKLVGKSLTLLNFVKTAQIVVLSGMQPTALYGVPVQPSRGTLLESINKSYAPAPLPVPLVDIFQKFAPTPVPLTQVAQTQVQRARSEVNDVLTDLERFIAVRDGPAFAAIVTYLKNPAISWPNAQSQTSALLTQMSADLVFDEQCDRNADRQLVKRACELAFLPMFKPYLPLGVAVYLLTHPLFPLGEPAFRALLPRLEKSDAMLYRQALVSLVGLKVEDLVRGLLSLDLPTFLDAGVRLREDFSNAQILSGVRQTFRASRSTAALPVLVERLSRYPETVPLMAPFVDAMGLLAWDAEALQRMRTELQTQITALETCLTASTAIADLFNTMGLNPSESAAVSVGEAKQRSAQHSQAVAGNERRVVPKYRVETLVL